MYAIMFIMWLFHNLPFFLCGFPTKAVFSYGYILLYIFMKDVFGYALLVTVVTVFSSVMCHSLTVMR